VALPSLERAARAEAGEDGVKSVVGRRLPLYPPQTFTDAEWAAWWLDYFDVLSDLPMAALEAGMLDWIRDPTSKFMPKPGELRDRSLKVQNKAAVACYRVRRVVNYRDPSSGDIYPIDAPNLRPMPTPRAKEAVKQMFEDFSAQLPREGQTRAIPPVSGPVDGGGLTEAMRALLARRQTQDAR
jgi:hypothetical protein